MDDLDREMVKEAIKTAIASQGQRFTSSKVFDRIPVVYKTFVGYLSLDERFQLLVPEQDRTWLP